MKSLVEEARGIIERSLNAEIDQDYTSKAKDWLKRFDASQGDQHDHKGDQSCAICGYDLTCPSCESS